MTDLDQNLDPNVAETVITTVKSANGDSETLRLTETGPSTGVFIGYIQSTFGPVVVNDCRLSVTINTGVTATYTDTVDGTDSTIDGALVDPFGLVFDSTNGNPINGATVTLINVATNAPAQVFCDDGVTPYPSSVISGSSFAACGATISLPAGSYRFPLAAPGTYRLQISPPTDFSFPSTVATNSLQALSGAPFSIVAGSRGEQFMLNPGPAVQIDVPLDPSSGSLQITKTTIKAVIGLGESLPYTLTIRNNSALAPVYARIATVSEVFRYQARVGLSCPHRGRPISRRRAPTTFSIATRCGSHADAAHFAEALRDRAWGSPKYCAAAPPLTSNSRAVTGCARRPVSRRAILAARDLSACNERWRMSDRPC